MLHHGLLLVLDRLCNCTVHDGVLQLQLFHGSLHALALLLDVAEIPLGIFQLGVLAFDLR